MKTIARLALAIIALFVLNLSMAAAQEGLRMEVGFSERIELPGTVANVVIGSPEIADVLPLTTNVYLLNAKRVGTTNVVAVDEGGNIIYYTRLHVRPVDIWPNFPVGVTHGTGNTRRYLCSPGFGCKATAGASACMSPDDIAADGTRCGDRAASIRLGGSEGELPPGGEPETEPDGEPEGQPAG